MLCMQNDPTFDQYKDAEIDGAAVSTIAVERCVSMEYECDVCVCV